MTLNEMKLGRPSPTALFPPTIEGFLAVEEGLTISPKSLKTWWPGTELNRRRQPFQGCALPPELPGHFVDARASRSLRETVPGTLSLGALTAGAANWNAQRACGTV